MRPVMLRLVLVCCWAPAVCCAVSCGTMVGASNFAAELPPAGTTGTRGRAGAAFAAISGDGGGATSKSIAGPLPPASSYEAFTTCGTIGRVLAFTLQGYAFTFALTPRPAQPPAPTTDT